MKKKIKILILCLMLILIGTLTVNAADATVNLVSSSREVKKGETFTLTLNAQCEEGINGLIGVVSCDEKIELVSITTGANWINMDPAPKFAILHNSLDTETIADIVNITFKVKDTAEVGTAKVIVSDIVLDSDTATNSTKNIGTKEIEVSIVDDPADDSTDDPTDKSEDDSGFEEIKPDDTKTEDKIPNTGVSSVIGIMVVSAVFGIVSLVRYNKYKGI